MSLMFSLKSEAIIRIHGSVLTQFNQMMSELSINEKQSLFRL